MKVIKRIIVVPEAHPSFIDAKCDRFYLANPDGTLGRKLGYTDNHQMLEAAVKTFVAQGYSVEVR